MASEVLTKHRSKTERRIEYLLDALTICKKSDILPAAEHLARIAGHHGLRLKLWHDISSEAPMNGPDGRELNSTIFGCETKRDGKWQKCNEVYRSQLIRACRVEDEVFWVNQDGFRTRRKNRYLEEISLKEFERRSLVKAAIVVPVHMSFGQISAAIFSDVSGSREDLSLEFTNLGSSLSELARRFLIGYVYVMRDNPYLPTEKVLTNREVECLRWAAFGKTDLEMSTIMDCRITNIRYHMKNVRKKLSASTRAQAVFRASQLGYLCAVS